MGSAIGYRVHAPAPCMNGDVGQEGSAQQRFGRGLDDWGEPLFRRRITSAPESTGQVLGRSGGTVNPNRFECQSPQLASYHSVGRLDHHSDSTILSQLASSEIGPKVFVCSGYLPWHGAIGHLRTSGFKTPAKGQGKSMLVRHYTLCYNHHKPRWFDD